MLLEVVFIVICSIIVVVFGISLMMYFMVFYNEKKGKPIEMEPLKGKLYDVFAERSRKLIASSNLIPWESREIRVNKHLTLRAKYYFVKEDAPLAIMVHGYKGVGIRDFSGGLVELLNRGSNVLVIDHRGHGRSDGHTISFGIREKYDVIRWIQFANKEFNNPDIYLYGISMGAATVLMVSGLKELPSNVRCAVADCPYSSVKQILRDSLRKMRVPFWIAYPFMYLSALLFAHFNINDGVVDNYLDNTKIPIMIIHGTTDDIVPVKHSRRLKEKYGEKIKYIEIEGAPHGMSYFVDYSRYSQELSNFLNSIKN